MQALASFFTGDPTHGVAGFYGGSTQVHLGPGPAVDSCHRAALRAALLTGERLEVTDPGVYRSRPVAAHRRALPGGPGGARRSSAHLGDQ